MRLCGPAIQQGQILRRPCDHAAAHGVLQPPLNGLDLRIELKGGQGHGDGIDLHPRRPRPGDQTIARRAVRLHQGGDSSGAAVVRFRRLQPERRPDQPQEQGCAPAWVIGQQAAPGRVGSRQSVLRRPMNERQVLRRTALILKPLQHAAENEELRQDVAQTPRQRALSLQGAAHGRHRQVRSQRQQSREPRRRAIIALQLRRRVARRPDQDAARQAKGQRSRHIAEQEADIAEQGGVERPQFSRLRRPHQGQDIGVAADRPLTIDDKGAGHDVGALYRDGDRHLLIGARQIVAGAHADPLAANHVHGVVDDGARAFGDVIFGDGRDDRRLFALVQRRRRQTPDGVGRI